MQVVGISVNGVPIYTGVDKSGVDPLSHGRKNSQIIFDKCLGNLDSSSLYNYLSFSPCIFNQSIKT